MKTHEAVDSRSLMMARRIAAKIDPDLELLGHARRSVRGGSKKEMFG